jgi:Na+-driven multidrug efflux pump
MLEGPVLATLMRLAAPTIALMFLQGVIAAGEAAFVGRLGSAALAGVSLSFPLVMLMTTLSAGAYGGGVASGVARAPAAPGMKMRENQSTLSSAPLERTAMGR